MPRIGILLPGQGLEPTYTNTQYDPMETNLYEGWRKGLRRLWGPGPTALLLPPYVTTHKVLAFGHCLPLDVSVAVLGFGIALLTRPDTPLIPREHVQ